MLGRLGGEEFLALLPDTGEEAAAHAAERLRAAVEAARGPVPLTASVGYAVLGAARRPTTSSGGPTTALYAAKAAGRNARPAALLPCLVAHDDDR